MFGFIKKLFGFGSADQTVSTTQAPYKVEAPTPVNPQITDAVLNQPVKSQLHKRSLRSLNHRVVKSRAVVVLRQSQQHLSSNLTV
jgi:hypothetical protein